jgi:hypothetical protein
LVSLAIAAKMPGGRADSAEDANVSAGRNSSREASFDENRRIVAVFVVFGLTSRRSQPICSSSGETAAPTVSGHRAGVWSSPAGCYFPNIQAPNIGA